MLPKEIKQQLCALSEPGYRSFVQKLTPGVQAVQGVRLPALRGLAKQIAREDPLGFWAAGMHDSFEEIMLNGLVMGYAKLPLEERWRYLDPFVARMDNWSVCDSTVMGCKWMQKDRPSVWAHLEPWLSSPHEFTVRFALVALLAHFMQPQWFPVIFSVCDRVNHPGYYAKMAVAWLVSVCMANAPEETLEYMMRDSLDDFTHHKAIQKCRESYRISPEHKAALAQLRRR